MRLNPFQLALWATLSLLLLPAAAHAATAKVIQLDSCGSSVNCERTGQGVTLNVVDVADGATENNRMTLRAEGDNAVVIRDEGAPLGAGDGCTALDAQSVRCPIRETTAANQDVQIVQVGLGMGDDTLRVEGNLSGRASLIGGEGADTIRGGDELDLMEGGPGADDLDGGGGNDIMSFAGRKVPVTVDLKRGQATVRGETDKVANIETVAGSPENDTLVGSDDADMLDGGLGDDRIDGGEGNDTLSGDGGGDIIAGGAGDDIIEGDPVEVVEEGFAPTGSDDIKGGPGDDRITDGGAAKGDVMEGGAGNDRITAGFGATNLRGGDGRDRLTGSPKGDKLEGGKGNDTIDGAAGKDEINAGKGRDKVKGGRGADRIDVRDSRRDTVSGVTRRDKVRRDRFDSLTR